MSAGGSPSVPVHAGGSGGADRAGLVLRWAVALTLLAAMLSLVRLGWQEFQARADTPVAYDELYFMACAARGLAIGEVPVAGCHDSKAPLIYLVHQWVQLGAGAGTVYDIGAVKAASVLLVVLVSALAALLAYQMAGGWAALATLALPAQLMGADVRLAGLKTELLGAVFMLAGLWVTVAWTRKPRVVAALGSGLLMGLALAAKQTFALALAGPLVALVWTLWHAPGARLRMAAHGGLFALACSLPLLAFAFGFARQGRLDEFLGSLLLYPLAYRPAVDMAAGDVLMAKLQGLISFLADLPLVAPMALLSVVVVGLSARGAAPSAASTGRLALSAVDRVALATVAASALGMVALLLIAPVQFYYHLLPGWLLMAVLVGAGLGGLLKSGPAWAKATAGVIVVLGALHQTWHVWTHEAVRPARQWNLPLVPKLPVQPGEFAYVAGVWPTFYVLNQLVPASSVMYPNALPGALAGWNYVPPSPDNDTGRRLLALQAANATRLLADFGRTPPRYIMVVDQETHQGPNPFNDIAALDTYIAAHCKRDRDVQATPSESGVLYACD